MKVRDARRFPAATKGISVQCSAGLALALAMITDMAADPSNQCAVVDAAGCLAAAGTVSNVFAAGQAGGVGESTAGNLVNQAGFLNAFLLRPAADADNDGVPDEADVDNDNDTLPDAVEIAGTGFDPVTPTLVNARDTDGDGAGDGAEAGAGTDPTDAAAHLRILAIADSVHGPVVKWLGRDGKTYLVMRRDGALGQTPSPVGTNTAFGGAGDWQVLTNEFTDATVNTNAAFYRIKLQPPQ